MSGQKIVLWTWNKFIIRLSMKFGENDTKLFKSNKSNNLPACKVSWNGLKHAYWTAHPSPDTYVALKTSEFWLKIRQRAEKTWMKGKWENQFKDQATLGWICKFSGRMFAYQVQGLEFDFNTAKQKQTTPKTSTENRQFKWLEKEMILFTSWDRVSLCIPRLA